MTGEVRTNSGESKVWRPDLTLIRFKQVPELHVETSQTEYPIWILFSGLTMLGKMALATACLLEFSCCFKKSCNTTVPDALTTLTYTRVPASLESTFRMVTLSSMLNNFDTAF